MYSTHQAVLTSNMVGGLPSRKRPLWIELGAGERAGKWVQLFPCRIVEGGKAFSAMETVAFERREGRRISVIPFEDVTGCAKEDPEAEQADENKGSGEKRNIGTLAKGLREAWISFLQREEEEEEEVEGKKDANTEGMQNEEHKAKKKKTNKLNILIGLGFIGLVCAMTVLVMLEPGPASLTLAWASVVGAGFAGCVVAGVCAGCQAAKRAREKLEQSAGEQVAKDASKQLRQHVVLWVFLWCYAVALLLLPGSVMANGSGVAPRLGGYVFLLVLWSFGWIFLWVQSRGDQHALACVRTVMWDPQTNDVLRPPSGYFPASYVDGIGGPEAEESGETGQEGGKKRKSALGE